MPELDVPDPDAERTLARRSVFLLTLSDALRPLTDAVAIEHTALNLLRTHLGASRALYAEALDQDGTVRVMAEHREPSLVSMEGLVLRFADFTPEALSDALAGRPLWKVDVQRNDHTLEQQGRYAAFGIRAWAMIPLVKAERLVAVLTVHAAAPRDWSAEELAILQEVAERTWAAVERARAEVALHDSEALVRTLVTTLPGGAVFVFDPDLRYRLAAGELLTGVGSSPQAYEGKTIAEALPPELVAETEHCVRGALAGELFEVERTHAGGAIVSLSRGAPLRDASGQVTGVLVVSHDITGRKAAEELKRVSAERQAFLLTLSDRLRTDVDERAIALTSLHLLVDYLRLDRAYVARVDQTRDVAEIGPEYRRPDLAPVEGVLTLSDFPVAFAQMQDTTLVLVDTAIDPALSDLDRRGFAALRMGALIIASARRGARTPIWALLVAVEDPRHWTAAEVALVEDVAERTWAAMERARAEAALRVSEEKFRTLFESIDEGFCLIDIVFGIDGTPVDYRFVQVNPAFSSMTGLPADALGKTALELVPDLEAFWVETYGRVALTGKGVRFESHSEAMNRWFDVYASCVGGAGSRQVALVFSDVTERKRVEAEIRNLNRSLEERVEARTRDLADQRAALEISNEELQAFNYSVSHDLMTPLRHIAGFTELAGKTLHDPEKTRRFLDVIAGGARRMETLIEAMLTLSRTGQRELIVGVVELDELLRQAQQDVQPQLAGRAIEWRIGPLPAVQGDRVTLQQVMTNLLENAVKYSRDRDPAVIEVWGEEDEQGWTVSVRANGAGFDSAYVGKLFGLFQRLHHHADFEGTGVGLSLVRRIITRHGGTVSATGAVGQGATFTFILPR